MQNIDPAYQWAKWLSAKKKALRTKVMPDDVVDEFARTFTEAKGELRPFLDDVWRDIQPLNGLK